MAPVELKSVVTASGQSNSAATPGADPSSFDQVRQHHIDVCISRPTFFNNIVYLRQLVAPSKLCVVMKSNAYGHGLASLAPVAVAAGADYIGICTNPEAAVIRGLGLNIPIFRLRMGLPVELEEGVCQLGIEEEIGTLEQAAYLAGLSQRIGRDVPVHLNIDTGMGRSGFFAENIEEIRRACKLPGLRIVGVFTHFPTADAANLQATHRSMELFEQSCLLLQDVLPQNVLKHTHNSAATVRLTDRRHQMVRAGAACFGVRTSQDFANPQELKPVMSVKTCVAQVREVPAGKTIGYGGLFTTKRPSRIASLPVGFGEGYPRSLFNKGIVLIHGQRCPVVGRVSLNIVTVDVTDLKTPVNWGDEVVLVGRQGDEEITFEFLADLFASVHTEINLMAGSMNPQIRYE
ncbi:MAG TPA: alanine racemase [Pirellulales bacterium]|nr:alanine racemase [Pirellulales bacterium]